MADSATRLFDHFRGHVRVLSVQANGGSVEVQVEHADGVWITADTITEDGVSELVFGYATVRIVPAGGATYEVH